VGAGLEEPFGDRRAEPAGRSRHDDVLAVHPHLLRWAAVEGYRGELTLARLLGLGRVGGWEYGRLRGPEIGEDLDCLRWLLLQ